MENKLNKELIIESRKLKNTEDYQVFEDIFKLVNLGLLNIEDFDTLCYGFDDDESEDSDYLSEGLTQSLFLTMKNYPIEDFTKKVIDAIEIFNNHALVSYRNILTYWFTDDDKIKYLSSYINTKNFEIRNLFKKIIIDEIGSIGDDEIIGYLAVGANKVLQGIE